MVGAYERPLSLTTMTSGLLGGGDVVQRLPAHAAGERAVADDRDDVALLAAQRERLGQAVGVGQRGRGVAVLDEVVLALGLARVAGEAAALAQQVEAVLAAGDDLVHVRLVAGVEQEPVLGRVEDPVQREGELDHAQVGAEVPAGAGDLRDQEVADLGGEEVQLLGGHPLEVLRAADCREQPTVV